MMWCGVKRLIALTALITLTACSTIDKGRPPPDSFPEHAVTVVVDSDLVTDRCGGSILAPALGCAVLDFIARTCTVYLRPSSGDWVLEHEKWHCRGYDHPGDSIIQDAWKEYESLQ